MMDTLERKKNYGLITILFVIVVLAGVAGGIALKSWVRAEIRKTVAAQVVAERYTLNHTACGLRAYAKTPLQQAQKTVDSETASKAAKKKAQTYITKTNEVLLIWGTIPPDFQCATLPKSPPQVK